ncbi:PREDICTED: uncharacterized protein LOC108557909 [Nicrophorus vespilloides]|uniref:Uncharacterized protein LOC108557909 n=1 Tax=Nicrophorus vespilloides TaxID=110193 RepID=A0ABM1M6B1_NICVS|nr:PREDICTED: uncharacterized protein LOC108557909 [Nicrophorus vespilloides]
MGLMVKSVLCLAFLVCVYGQKVTKLEDCNCWEGYEAKQDNDGKIMCQGKMVLALKPCNLPEAPKCVCTEDTVTGILSDAEGTWCNQRKAGKEVKRWPCENKDEWSAYKVKYAEFEKSYAL